MNIHIAVKRTPRLGDLLGSREPPLLIHPMVHNLIDQVVIEGWALGCEMLQVYRKMPFLSGEALHARLVDDLHEYFINLRDASSDTLDLHDRYNNPRHYLPLCEWQCKRGLHSTAPVSWDSFIQDPPAIVQGGGHGGNLVYSLWVDYIQGNSHLTSLERDIHRLLGAGWYQRSVSGNELEEIYHGYWETILRCVGGEVEAVWDYLAQGLINLREYLEPAFRISEQEGYGYTFYVHEVPNDDLIIVGEYS